MNSTNLYDGKLNLSFIVVCILIGMASSFLPWGVLIFSILIYLLIFGIQYPLKVITKKREIIGILDILQY